MATRVSLRWLGWMPVAVVFNNICYTLQSVNGRSMKPTLNPDSSSWRDIAVFDRTVVFEYKCKRGDIVSLSSPIEPNTYLVKRIIALEGDTVQTLSPYPDSEVIIPEGRVWVEGDERYHSQDSNYFGPVPLALINARLAFIVWPPSRFGPIRSPSAGSEKSVPLHSPAWKERQNAAALEQWRTARVRAAQQRTASHEKSEC